MSKKSGFIYETKDEKQEIAIAFHVEQRSEFVKLKKIYVHIIDGKNERKVLKDRENLVFMGYVD